MHAGDVEAALMRRLHFRDDLVEGERAGVDDAGTGGRRATTASGTSEPA